MTEQRLLFLCTGNYYRSRFAEEYFNHHAPQRKVLWRADSMGLAEEMSRLRNPGPISKFTLAELERLGIDPTGHERYPVKVAREHFSDFHSVIALSEAEHLPMVEKQFPDLVGEIRFWEVGDLPLETPEQALGKIRQLTEELLEECRFDQ